MLFGNDRSCVVLRAAGKRGKPNVIPEVALVQRSAVEATAEDAGENCPLALARSRSLFEERLSHDTAKPRGDGGVRTIT